jgi:hypothetical protein
VWPLATGHPAHCSPRLHHPLQLPMQLLHLSTHMTAAPLQVNLND